MCWGMCSVMSDYDPMNYKLPDSFVHGFSRHQCWSWLPFPSLEDLPNPGIEPKSLHLLHWQTDSLTLCHLGSTAVAAKSLQLCLTLCDPIDGSPPGSPVSGILQARTLEWVAISFSNAWKWKVKVKSLSPVWPLVTPWNATYQAPLSMGVSRQEYWSELPFPSPPGKHKLLLNNFSILKVTF